jgi:hypothetical protein
VDYAVGLESFRAEHEGQEGYADGSEIGCEEFFGFVNVYEYRVGYVKRNLVCGR